MYYSVSLCITLYHSVPLCTTLHHSVPLFTTLYHSVSLCTTLYHSVLICINIQYVKFEWLKNLLFPLGNRICLIFCSFLSTFRAANSLWGLKNYKTKLRSMPDLLMFLCNRDWEKWEIQNAYLHKLYKHTFTLSIHNWSTVLNCALSVCALYTACGPFCFLQFKFCAQDYYFSHSLENKPIYQNALQNKNPFQHCILFIFSQQSLLILCNLN